MYTFEDLIDAQMEVRKILIESGVDIDVANTMFLHNMTIGCKQISIFNSTNHDASTSSKEAGPSATSF